MRKKSQLKQTPRALLPDPDHIARFCHHQRILRDPADGKLISIVDAFKLRPGEGELSVEHYEKLGNDFRSCMKGAAAVFRFKIKFSPVTLDSMVSILNVGEVGKIGKAASKPLKIRDKS